MKPSYVLRLRVRLATARSIRVRKVIQHKKIKHNSGKKAYATLRTPLHPFHTVAHVPYIIYIVTTALDHAPPGIRSATPLSQVCRRVGDKGDELQVDWPGQVQAVSGPARAGGARAHLPCVQSSPIWPASAAYNWQRIGAEAVPKLRAT